MSHSESYKRLLNRMGYYDYQSGLIYRHFNQDSGWDAHLRRCREYIIRAINLYNPDKITVLGSGWLLELPVAELTDKVKEITLIDIIHPPDVKKQARKLSNVEILESDVSGGLIEMIYNLVRQQPLFRKLNTIRDIRIPDYRFAADPGMIISLNLLTQLEVLPVRFLERKARISREEISEFRSSVQKKHLELLSGYRSVLITDYEEVFTTRSGDVYTEKTLIADLPDGCDSEKWTWHFDIKGSDYYNKRSIMKVIAMIIK